MRHFYLIGTEIDGQEQYIVHIGTRERALQKAHEFENDGFLVWTVAKARTEQAMEDYCRKFNIQPKKELL